MTDPVADALRPRFAAAAREAREVLAGGGTGDVQVLFGHLPKATVSIMAGLDSEGLHVRTFSMSIPSVLGMPNDPDSVPSFVAATAFLKAESDTERALLYLNAFEADGPRILANTVRSCLFGLLKAGIDLPALVEESVASSVMDV